MLENAISDAKLDNGHWSMEDVAKYYSENKLGKLFLPYGESKWRDDTDQGRASYGRHDSFFQLRLHNFYENLTDMDYGVPNIHPINDIVGVIVYGPTVRYNTFATKLKKALAQKQAETANGHSSWKISKMFDSLKEGLHEYLAYHKNKEKTANGTTKDHSPKYAKFLAIVNNKISDMEVDGDPSKRKRRHNYNSRFEENDPIISNDEGGFRIMYMTKDQLEEELLYSNPERTKKILTHGVPLFYDDRLKNLYGMLGMKNMAFYDEKQLKENNSDRFKKALQENISARKSYAISNNGYLDCIVE